MSGWFLKPMTPIDHCFARDSIAAAQADKPLDWWELEKEKGEKEGEIRRLMNLQVAYEKCRYDIEVDFDEQKEKDKKPDATLDSELLDPLSIYENPAKDREELAQEAKDLYAEADEKKVEYTAKEVELAALEK